METFRTPNVYLAGPLGFTTAGLAYHHERVLPAVRSVGLEPLDPWDLPREIQEVFDLPRNSRERRERLPRINREVGRRNAELIDASQGMLAILDGNDVDSGTAAEIGYACALHKPIVGLRSDLRLTGDNEATLVNLQVEWFIVDSGGSLTTDLDEAVGMLSTLLGEAPARRQPA